ncbi:MAG: hypothetical protein JOZ75_01760 [Candidatus Dormibacteraeota bacterium]|nr:hypothetical protein [Candidatus Dormibacteraeota bacterium]
MFRALGARLGIDWRGLDSAGVTAGVVAAIWEWAAAGVDAPQTWTEGELSDGRCHVDAVHAVGATRELYRTVVHRPDEWEPSTLWRTTVDVVHAPHKVEVGIVAEQDLLDPAVTTVPLQPPLMELLRGLAQRGAWAGSHKVSAGAQAVVGTEGVVRFIDTVLLDPERALPVLLFTAIKEHDGVFMPESTDPSLVARELCGLAHVYVLPRVEDTHKMTKRLGQLSAYDGAMRLYWPHFRMTDRTTRHPLLLRTRLTTASVLGMMRRIVEAGARGYRPPAGTQSLLALSWRREEQRRIGARVMGETNLQRTVSALNQELEHAINENVRLAQELESAQIDLDRARQRLAELPSEGADPGIAGWQRLGVDAMRDAISVPVSPPVPSA